MNCVSPILCGGKPSKSINQRALSRYEKYRKNGEHAAEPLSITRSIYSKLKHIHTHKQTQKVGDHVKQQQQKNWYKILVKIFTTTQKIEIHNTKATTPRKRMINVAQRLSKCLKTIGNCAECGERGRDREKEEL